MTGRAGGLAFTATVAVAAWLAVQSFGQSTELHPRHEALTGAAVRAERAFAVVDSVKRTGGLGFPADSPVRWRTLLGRDYSAMTTTLGSLPAKEVSTNPAWASLVAGWLVDAGVGAGDTVAVTVSGSFPALALAVLAAVTELEATPVIVSSLGASSFGANLREATWIDMETWVREAGVLDVRSSLVTTGGNDDDASGLQPEGVAWIEAAALRNGATLERFASLEAAMAARTELLAGARPAALVNVGGGHAMAGSCPHAGILPVGPWDGDEGCRCPGRGVIARLAQRDVPVLHLLRVRELATRYGLDFEPGRTYENGNSIIRVARPDPWGILAALASIIATLVATGRKRT